jgi:hypothetical protein
MKNKDHKFIYDAETSQKLGIKIYFVKCKKTTGIFSTSLWIKYPSTKQKCICCGEFI